MGSKLRLTVAYRGTCEPFDPGGGKRSPKGSGAVGKLVEDLTAKAGGGTTFGLGPTGHLHPGGSRRMGDDPATSVCDAWGECHDHENLYVTGAPLLVAGGCTNTTLTFCALALRTAGRLAQKLRA